MSGLTGEGTGAASVVLPAERPGQSAPQPLLEQRQAIADAAAAGAWRTNPPAESVMIGGVRALRFDPPGPSRGVVLHLHGGAFRIGAPEVVGLFAAALAERCGVSVVCPAYRLSPEHPFPAALLDGLAVLRALGGEAPLILSGDSAGGNIAAVLTSRAVAEGRKVAGLMLLSAWLDLTLTSPGYETNAASDPLFSRKAAEAAKALYLQGVASDSPLVSPLRGDLRGFPHTLVSLGEGEVLAEDGRRFHAALQAAGILATLAAVPGMEHVAVTRSLDLPGARETFGSVAAFVDAVISARP